MGSSEAEADRGGSAASISSSSPPPLPPLPPNRWGELHALRRREGRKKRDKKQQQLQKGTCGGGGVAGPGAAERGLSPQPEWNCSADDRLALDSQGRRSRVRVREAREEETRHSDRRTGEHRDPCSDLVLNPELCNNMNANPNPCSSPNFSNPNLPHYGAHPFPLMAMQCPYPQIQYVPIANGFGFPYMMPCWASAMSSVTAVPDLAIEVFQPVACRTVQPFSPLVVVPTDGGSPPAIKGVESSGGKGTGIRAAPSWTASLGTNRSSAISDHQSNSVQGGNSGGDIRSHNAPVERAQPQLSPQASNLLHGQSEHSISSRQIEPAANEMAVEGPCGKGSSSNSNGDQFPVAKLEGSTSVSTPVPAADDPISSQASSSLPQMPRVSATGDGPNGKTITGFLYRYTSTEVSIVCVCHGSSFSPAEFVEHAGGTDKVNPLRHISVVPS
uniref:Ninja-family protein n=1 Tax=Anthurium amnicola TaxID=1678845 RepID=A0A1D1Y4E5_9ARAE